MAYCIWTLGSTGFINKPDCGCYCQYTIHIFLMELGVFVYKECAAAAAAAVVVVPDPSQRLLLLLYDLQVSATLLGEPDLGLLTPPEMARKAGQIVYSIPNVPVLVDADTGRGPHRIVSSQPVLTSRMQQLLERPTHHSEAAIHLNRNVLVLTRPKRRE